MTAVEQALAEIDQAIADMAPAHEGLRDYALLDIKAETKAQVNAAIGLYDQRLSHLTTTKDRLQQLLADGYPTLEIPAVEKAVYDDLKENEATIAAALARFKQNEAVSLSIVPGTPTDKPTT